MSEPEGPAMETLPSGEQLEQTDMVAQTETQRVYDQPGDAYQQETQSSKSQKSHPKNGIPPRRLSTATKRSVPSTPAPAIRSNPLSGSRNAPGSGLSKPPTRPLASSSARRPASNFAGTTAASSGHKKTPSINSVDKTNKGDLNVLDENKKPTNSKPETKRYSYGRSDSGPPNETSPQDKAKQIQTSGNTNSPNKSAPRSSINPRLSGGGITPRNARPTASSKRGAIGNEAPRKRLSTIPASPAPTQFDSAISTSAPHPLSTSTRAGRPALGSRKSTMSVTIEQRLREMELVHQMINIAMADGDESDEVKEEYGRKVDESLASLRTRLEEARRNEGISDAEVNNQADGLSHQEQSVSETIQPNVDVGELREALSKSQVRVSELNTEISVLQDDLNRSKTAERDAQELATERGASIDMTNKMHEETKVALERLREEQTSKIKELMVSHEKELADTLSRLDESESRLKNELADTLSRVDESESRHKKELADSIKEFEEAKHLREEADSQIETHKSRLQALEHELKAEKDRGLDAASKLHYLQSDVSNLQSQLSEVSAERQKLQDTWQGLNEEYHIKTTDKDRDILNLKSEIEDLENSQRSKLEEVESRLSVQKTALETELTDLRRDMQELETSHRSMVAAHGSELALKEQEIKGLGKVIEDFQDKIRELHEMKERDLDETKHDLIQEHERAISNFRRKHQEEIDEAKMKHFQGCEGLREQHQNIIESSKAAHAAEVEDIQRMLAESNNRLEETNLAKIEALKRADSLDKKISTLIAERDDVKKANLSTEAALKLASDEVTNLKKSLETLSVESRDKEEQHSTAIQKIKDEFDSKAKFYATDLKTQESKSQSSLQDMQNNYDALLATWTETEKEYPVAIKKLETEHAEAVQNHAQNLEDLKNEHAKEMEVSASKAELKHQQEVENLKLEHEKEFSTLCKDFQDKESAKSLALQEEHDSALSDVTSQLHKQSELLARTEEELQLFKDKEDCKVPAEDEGLLQHLGELKTQLADSQAEAAQAKEEITRLIAVVEEAETVLPDTTEADKLRHEMSELVAQHSAEISKLQERAADEYEKREKERRQGADVRDRLASESERMRNDLLMAQANSEEHQRALEHSMIRVQEADKNHAAARQAAEHHQNELQKTLEELKAAQVEMEKSKAEKLQSEAELHADKQELEALQAAADLERKKNEQLKEQLQEIELASERQATKLREVECALKVTTAELVEAQTTRPNGSEYSASPAPKSGLRSSRWGALSKADQDSDDDEQECGDLGPSIEGNMAGIQEQIRQLEDINNDMLEDEHRVLKLLSEVNKPSPGPTSKDSLNDVSNQNLSDSLDGSPQSTPHKYQDEAPRLVSYGSLYEEL